MSNSYYKPCKEFDICNELTEKYLNTKQYKKCFEGHLVLAMQGGILLPNVKSVISIIMV